MGLIYRERGGGIMGYNPLCGFGVTWPFAKFELHDDKIVLDAWFKKAVLTFQEIDVVKRFFFIPILFDLIKINHHGSALRWLLFASFNATKIMQLLEERGIPVQRIGLATLGRSCGVRS